MVQYFAALPGDQLCRELIHKRDAYYKWLMTSGRLGRWRMAFDTYYGQRDQHNSSYVTASGEKGELSFLMANEYRSLVQSVLVLATQTRPSVECATVNSDRASEDQAIFGKQLLDYYRKDGGLDSSVRLALEIALLLDHSWIFTLWNVTKGNPVRPDMKGGVVTEGDIETRPRTPLDAFSDWTNDNGRDFHWQHVTDLVNKFDLAAQFPEKADGILACQRDKSRDSMYRFGDQGVYGYDYEDSPLIEVHTFYHAKTPALPNGRMYQYVDEKTWLYDDKLPYRRLPGRRVCPVEMITSSLGYSNMNDMIALQDVLDAMVSAAVTNMTSCGVNNIWVKPNSNIDFEQLAEGMNYIESEEKPEVLQLNKLPPEWFNLANWVVSRMEAYSGVNAVARGNTQGKDLSGAAMALLQSMAIQINSGVQAAYNQVVEDVNNDALSHLQDFAKVPKLALIAGETGKYMLEKFSQASIDKINRVYCRQSNSMQDTTAGKMVILKDLMAIPGVITDSQKYLEVLQTGNLRPAVEDETRIAAAIRGENEALSKGQQVLALQYENHPKHILSHVANMNDPESKKDPNLVNAHLAHINHHIQQWASGDPMILQALGIPPIAPPPMPMGAPPPPGNGKPSEADKNLQAPQAAGGPQRSPAGEPSLPKNPMTGKQWNPSNGGLQ